MSQISRANKIRERQNLEFNTKPIMQQTTNVFLKKDSNSIANNSSIPVRAGEARSHNRRSNKAIGVLSSDTAMKKKSDHVGGIYTESKARGGYESVNMDQQTILDSAIVGAGKSSKYMSSAKADLQQRNMNNASFER